MGHSDEYVRGYTTKNGTCVATYYQSSNGTTLDNYRSGPRFWDQRSDWRAVGSVVLDGADDEQTETQD